MNATSAAASARAPRPSAPQRILVGARVCFAKLGIERATVVDIAEAAGYSRPVIYKHFADKADIVDSVCLEEMRALQAELNKRLSRAEPYADQFVEAILQAVLLAHDNIYIQRFMQDRETWVRSQSAGGKVHDWVRSSWSNFLHRGIENQTLAQDLEVDETVTWISMVQSLLLLRYASEEMDQASMRRFIRRFVVKPLLA